MYKYYAIISILCAILVPVSAFLAVLTVKAVRRQIKLHYSITLVELKAPKLQYYISAAVMACFAFYIIAQMCDAGAPIVTAFEKNFGATRLQSNLALTVVLVFALCFEAFALVLALSKNAVVDKGIYTNFERIDWHDVCEYIIDEEKSVVILSQARGAFSTIRGTTPPFKVAKNDIPKLMFILNKNKNKFSGFYN